MSTIYNPVRNEPVPDMQFERCLSALPPQFAQGSYAEAADRWLNRDK